MNRLMWLRSVNLTVMTADDGFNTTILFQIYPPNDAKIAKMIQICIESEQKLNKFL